MIMPEATIRSMFLRLKPPPSATSDQQSHSHTRASSIRPAVFTAFMCQGNTLIIC